MAFSILCGFKEIFYEAIFLSLFIPGCFLFFDFFPFRPDN
jgi:hypothetical protein